MKPEKLFFEALEQSAFDKEKQILLKDKLDELVTQINSSKSFFSDMELAKTRASFIKNKTLENLDKYLIEFESNFIKKGGKVIWAQDNEEAVLEISKLIEKRNVKQAIKNRSLLFEEIDLTNVLKEKKISIIESDFGNFIQSAVNKTSYHPIYPTINQTIQSLHEILKKSHQLDDNASAQQLADCISLEVNEQLKQTEIAISGVNFLIADTGSMVVFENEANTAKLAAFPKTQIAIAGIEDIIPSINELDLFMHLYSTHSIGSNSYAYTHLISGPKQNDEFDGSEEIYLILIDNGRSEVLSQISQRSALSCVKCGACFNVCEVYRNIGGHAYQAVYNGPIGSITTPLMKGMEDYKYLSFASASSMECTAECPVKIDLPKLLQHNRTLSIKSSPPGKTEKLSIFFWKTAMLKRSNMDKGGAKLKNFMLRQFFKKSWGERREIPTVVQKSFNQIWRERKGIK